MPKIHNGNYTLVNELTGEHRTFQIRTVRNGSLKDKRIAALLTGPDNNGDYTGFAFVEDDRLKVWNKRKGEEKWSPFQWYAAMFNQFGCDGGDFMGKRYRVECSKRCLRCNRLLTHPESLASGYGPECVNKI